MDAGASAEILTEEWRVEFAALFREFAESFPDTLQGRNHIDAYDRDRNSGRENFRRIVKATERGEDVTDRVLIELLPHADTEANRSKGAWIHVAPAVQSDVKRWFEGIGWTRPEDWPKAAGALLRFVIRCDENPGQLTEACEEFSALPYSKGFQAGLVTPILNALRPEHFLLVNNKSRAVINHFAGTSYSQRLADYPAINETGLQLVAELGKEMRHPALEEMRDADRFDMFSHWLVAIKKQRLGPVRFWKIAPGANAWQWEECRDNGFIAVGWDEMGDVSGMSRTEFDARRDELVAEHPDWTKGGVDQVWKFSRIQEGDRVLANRGTDQVLGIGTVIGPYEFVPGVRHGHRLPVRWDDVTLRSVKQGNWRSTLASVSKQRFEDILNAPPAEPPPEPGNGGDGPSPESPFSDTTFDLLAGLHENPTRDYYQGHKEAFGEHIQEPFQRLFLRIASQLPGPIVEVMETQSRLFARILKNDYGRGGAWDFYWGAFYPKGGRRITDAQLSMVIDRNRLEFGFYIGEYASDQRERFIRNCRENWEELARLLRENLEDEEILYGSIGDDNLVPWDEWIKDPEQAGIDVSVVLSQDKVLRTAEDDLIARAVRTYERLFPLVLLAIEDDPLSAIGDYLEISTDEPDLNPVYDLAQCAEETGFELATLERWVRAIQRKGQAIVYGPPGTGKTFIAERLAWHLIGDGDGFSDLVQFHPAYAYEDFVQGIRPQSKDGGLEYPLLPGRFLTFCGEARKRAGLCVLIIDEINRADLARVFGELMYLFEYREREVPLAGGKRFAIPENVRIIGTMNTADRSIALVDYALRRRFAFLELYPDYGVLRRYHEDTGFPVEGLIRVLERVNQEIGDRHYAIGITFFLREDLAQEIEDIWRMEIEPYLEEYFFDRPEKTEGLRWNTVRGIIYP